MIELTERIGAKPVYRITPIDKPNFKNMDTKQKGETTKDDKSNTKKKQWTLTDEDDKGQSFDENI